MARGDFPACLAAAWAVLTISASCAAAARGTYRSTRNVGTAVTPPPSPGRRIRNGPVPARTAAGGGASPRPSGIPRSAQRDRPGRADDLLEGRRRKRPRALAAGLRADGQDAQLVGAAAAEVGVCAGAAAQLVGALHVHREQVRLGVEALRAGALGMGDHERPCGEGDGVGGVGGAGVGAAGGEHAPARGEGALRTEQGLAALRAAAAAHLSPAGQLQVATALDMIAATEARLGPLRHQLADAARHLTGAKVLAARLYGVGPLTALALTCWLAGEGRFSSSRNPVRFAGLDITVHSPDPQRPPRPLPPQ